MREATTTGHPGGISVPLVVVPDGERLGTGAEVTALLLSASLLAIASAELFPFQMRTVVSLSGDRLDATHYGFYSTGVGILIGILAIRSLMSAAHRLNVDETVWSELVLVGLVAVAWAVPAGQNRRRSEVVGPKSRWDLQSAIMPSNQMLTTKVRPDDDFDLTSLRAAPVWVWRSR